MYVLDKHAYYLHILKTMPGSFIMKQFMVQSYCLFFPQFWWVIIICKYFVFYVSTDKIPGKYIYYIPLCKMVSMSNSFCKNMGD